MTIRNLKIFIAVAEEGSVTRAAEKLFIAQPTVSIAIREIEEYYGIQLFDRINKRLKISLDGKMFLEYAKRIILLMEEMDNTFKNPDILGDLRIGSSVTFGVNMMPTIIRKFSDLYQDINVLVQIDSSEAIERKILDNELDISVIDGNVHSENIVSYEIDQDRLVPVCSSKRYGQKDLPLSLEEFSKEKFLLREKNSGIHELFIEAMHVKGYDVVPLWESTSTQALVQAAIKNIGITMLPESLIEKEISEGSLKILPIQGFEITRRIKIIYHKNKFLSPSMKMMIKLIEEECESRLKNR